MKILTSIKALIFAITFFLFSYATTVMADSVAEKLLPHDPGITGWQLAGDSYHYLPGNLYNYINGAADLFISYGFVKLVGAEYTPGSDRKDYLIADIYDMGNKLNAFGVFQSKRNPESSLLKIGTGAYGDEKYIFFYKDRFYAEIQGNQSMQQNKNVLMTLAKKSGEWPIRGFHPALRAQLFTGCRQSARIGNVHHRRYFGTCLP